MRSHSTWLALSALLVAATAIGAQPPVVSPWQVGGVIRSGAGWHAGPEVARVLGTRGPMRLRAEFTALVSLVGPSALAYRTPGPDRDARRASFSGALGLSGEFGSRRDVQRTWFVNASAAVTAVRWGAGTFTLGQPPYTSRDPEGTTTVAPAVGLGFGRECGALGARTRFELRVDRHFDAVAPISGVRLALSRSW